MSVSVRVARLVGSAVLLLAVAAPAALAYEGQVAQTVSVTAPAGPVACGTDVVVSATILDSAGQPISEQPVGWSFEQSLTGDTIADDETVSDAAGVAQTSVRLACAAGQRTVVATADDAFAAVVLGVQAAGLPRTDTGTGTMNWGVAGAALIAIIGFALVTRRILARR